MKLFYKLLIIFTLPLYSSLSAQTQEVWVDVDMKQIAPGRQLDKGFDITSYRTTFLDLPNMRGILRDAPMEFTPEGKDAPVSLEIPMPDGTMESFAIVESPIMEAGLAAKYPGIKTFAGRSLTNPTSRIRLDYNNENFNAIILTTEGTILITPFADDLNDYYVSFRLKNVSLANHDHGFFTCEVHDEEIASPAILDKDYTINPEDDRVLEVVDLQTYRYAVATTGEYSNGPGGGTMNSVMNNVATITNQLTAVFEVESAIRLIMIDNTDELFFFNASTDPYNNGDLPTMITQNQLEINNTIGTANYDLGHVYGTMSGGLASLASVCNDQLKARAGSAPFGSSSGAFFYLTIAHEIGHQFNATHTFNKCDDNVTPATAYEPGAGYTLMSYAGASDCSSQWNENQSSDYFHINSLVRIKEFSRNGNTGGSCDVAITVGNEAPTANIPIDGGFFIPISTPFVLEGEATDPDDTNLTYCWEQYNLGPESMLGFPTGNAPAFRSYDPVTTPVRVFPRLVDLVDNISNPHEVLPTYNRDLNFRMTVRDNNTGAGATDFAEIAFKATNTAGPFVVMTPNTATTNWEVGDYVEVTWDVANTDNDIVNCQFVNISLSLDGGFTYPIDLCTGAFNDGSAFVDVPDAVTSQARIRVAAADNIFFDISDEDFQILPAANAGFAFSATPHVVPVVCLPELIGIVIETSSLVNFENEITFSIDGDLPPGAVATFSEPTVLPGVQTILNIDLTNVTEEGIFSINIKGEADGADTEIRTIELNLVNTDFSALTPLSPNAANTPILPTFTWTDIAHADSYEIQVSTSPAFDNIIFTSVETTNSVAIAVALEVSTQYFWRIRAINECGEFNYTTPIAFQTVALTCNEKTSEDTPLNIPATGNPTINSTINISDAGLISDLNIKNIQGQHNQLRDIEFILTSPNGTAVTFLENNLCSSAQPFSFGLDDEGLAFNCPPANGVSYMDSGDATLASFIGEEVSGNWTLGVHKVDDFFNQSGTFTSWTLEYCGSFPAANPFITLNETACVTPLGSRAITESFLDIDDTDNSANQLIYTLVTIPQNGNLTLNGVTLAVGSTFSQSDIANFNVYYVNTNADVLTDNFSFTVIDGNGGFLGVSTFNIEILDESECISSITDIQPERDILVYPNPAKENIFVEFKQLISGQVNTNIVDVQGRILSTQGFENVVGKIELNTANLPSGIYFITFHTSSNIFTKKITIVN